MLLHTVDWWPQEDTASTLAVRRRLPYLFPVASLETTVHALIDDSAWSLCQHLYDQVLYRELLMEHIPVCGALALGTVNARLVSHSWPQEVQGLLAGALTLVTDYASGRPVCRAEVQSMLKEVAPVTAKWCHRRAPGAQRLAVKSALAVVRAAASSRTISELATKLAAAVALAEGAAVAALARQDRGATPRLENAARAHIWQSALLHLELAISTGVPADRV